MSINPEDLSIGQSLDLDMTSVDLLFWWSRNEVKFPRIAIVARHFLSVQASSAASEREFSTAGITMDVKRSSLKPEKLEMLSMIRSNEDMIESMHQYMKYE